MNFAINQNYAGVLDISPAFTSSSTTWRVDVRFKVNVLNSWAVLINHVPNRFLTSLSARFTSDFFGRDEVTFRINSVDYKFNAPNADQVFGDGNYHELSFICDGTTLTCYRDGSQLSNALSCTVALSSFDCFGDARSLAQDSSLERVAVYESTDTSVPVHIWDANSSDTSNTGSAPVLIDTVAGRNAVGGAAFPTDGTAWLSYTPPADVTPDAFPITPLTDQPLSTTVESTAITVTGVDAATDIPISIVGGNYKVSTDGGSTYGAFTAVSGNVQLNDKVIVNVLTSGTEGTTTTATLTIGGVTSDFNATTTAPPAMTIDQATASHGDTLTFTSEMLDGTSAKLIDSSLNELAIASLTNNGDGTYSALIPALTDGLVGIEVGTLTLALTNGSEISQDTFDLVPLTGYTQVIAATQSGELSPQDWGYVGVGGLDNPAVTGDVVWNKDITGLEAAVNGLYIFDFATFTPPQTAELWLQDQATLTWTYVSTTFAAAGGEDTTPDVPNLGVDVTGVEPNTYVTRSFVASGITTAIDWTATGSAQVSLNASSGFGASVNAGNGTTIYVRLQASETFGGVVTGGVAGDSFSVTTRAQLAPTLVSTLTLTGYVGQSFSRTLSINGGDPAESWSIVGGADQLDFSVTNAGVFSRTANPDAESSATVQVTATNAAGTSNIMNITINFIAYDPNKVTFVGVRSYKGIRTARG